jgi:ABC-type multidrug transport system fused ATPase/permease subunit
VTAARWLLRRRLGLVLASLGLMAIGPYLGSIPIRTLPDVISLAQGGRATGELRAMLGDRADSLPAAMVALLVVGTLSFLLALLGTRVGASLSAKASVDLRLLVHERLLERPPDVAREKANQIRGALLEQSRTVAAFVTNTLPATMGVLFAIVIWSTTLWGSLASSHHTGAAGAIVAGAVLLMVTINGGLAVLAGRKTRAIQKTIVDDYGKFAGLVGESVDELTSLQLHVAQDAQHQRLADTLEKMAKAEIGVASWSGFATAASGGIVLLAVPLAVIAWRALELPNAQLAVMVPALMMLQRSVAGVGSLWTSYRLATPAIELVDKLVAPEPTIKDPAGVKALPSAKGKVLVDHVSWSAGDRQVLRDIVLAVEPGEHLAIVGRGGCGKSTLLQLVLRVAKPSGGRVLVDGTDIAGVALGDLRRRVALLDQHPAFFARSVRENLVLDGAKVDDARIFELAVRVQAREIIDQLGGLDRVMPARGGTLSGSERRRLALIRLLLRDPDILLVDEIEAGLPQVMAQELFAAVRELGAGKTVLAVTHRPDLLHTDRVAFVHDGAILATGTHDELARSCEPYRSLLADKETTG